MSAITLSVTAPLLAAAELPGEVQHVAVPPIIAHPGIWLGPSLNKQR